MPSIPRPAIVTRAVVLMIIAGVALVIDMIAVIFGAGGYADRVSAAIDRSSVDHRATDAVLPIARAMPFLVIAVMLVAAITLFVLARLVAGGSFAARIVTWVAIGLALCCDACGLSSAGAGFSGVASVSAFSRDSSGTHTFSQRLPAGYPDWYQPLSLGLAMVVVVCLISACVLLALPASNAYFRRQPKPVLMPPGYVPFAPAQPDLAGYLAELARRRDRGEITEAQYAAEHARVTGYPPR